jgi:pyrimidine-specific ribonucleoside hydrolase
VFVAFDMETNDPDDALTLCLLATHPAVTLTAVSVNPGTRAQLGIVRRLLAELDCSGVPVGARDPNADGDKVSEFHRTWLGAVPDAEPDGPAHAILARAIEAEPSTVLLCGAPLHNVRALTREHPDLQVARLVVQGGFAGDNLVPPERRLAKFDGRTMSESHNLSANKKAAQAVLADSAFVRKELVAKNVTHGVLWDATFQRAIDALPAVTPGVALMRAAMERYLEEVPAGKALHDPLAACAAIDPSIIEWAEVEVLYGGGKWGAEPAPGTNTFISVDVDREAFFATLTAT